MLKNELLELIKDLEENADIDEVILSNGFAKPVTDVEGLNKLLSSNKEFQGLFDGKVTAGIESFKKNGMQKLIEAEVLKRTGKNETPEQKAIRELQEKLSNMEKEKTRAEMVAKYKDVLASKKIPSSMIDFLLGQDEETTGANIELFQNGMQEYIDSQVKARLGASEYVPPTQGGQVGKITWEEVQQDATLYEAYAKQEKLI